MEQFRCVLQLYLILTGMTHTCSSSIHGVSVSRRNILTQQCLQQNVFQCKLSSVCSKCTISLNASNELKFIDKSELNEMSIFDAAKRAPGLAFSCGEHNVTVLKQETLYLVTADQYNGLLLRGFSVKAKKLTKTRIRLPIGTRSVKLDSHRCILYLHTRINTNDAILYQSNGNQQTMWSLFLSTKFLVGFAVSSKSQNLYFIRSKNGRGRLFQNSVGKIKFLKGFQMYRLHGELDLHIDDATSCLFWHAGINFMRYSITHMTLRRYALKEIGKSWAHFTVVLPRLDIYCCHKSEDNRFVIRKESVLNQKKRSSVLLLRWSGKCNGLVTLNKNLFVASGETVRFVTTKGVNVWEVAFSFRIISLMG